MKKKTTFLKSLLVAAGLLAGVNGAWADVTSIYERGTTNAWSASDIGEGAWSTPSSGTAEIVAGTGLKYTSANNGSGSTTLAISTEENSKLVWSFTWDTGGSTGRGGNRNYLRFGDVELRAMGQDQKSVIVIGGVETTIGSNKDDVRGDKVWTGTITIDKATGNVEYDITLPASGNKQGSGVLASSDFSSVVLGFERGGRTNTSYSTLQKIEITEEKQSVTTASYTVQYLCGTDVVKEAVIRTGVVGQEITLSDADKETVYANDKKYVYANDDSEGKTIAEGVVVTVNFNESAKYTYILNAVDGDGNLLRQLATGTQFDGDAQKVYYPKTFKQDGKYYTIAANGGYPWYGTTFTAAETRNLTYAEDNSLAYFFDCEDLPHTHSWAATGTQPDRYSNGLAARLFQNSYAYTEPLEGGVYTLTMWARNNASSSTANIDIYVRDADGNDGEKITFADDWAKGGQALQTIENITIPTGSYLVFDNNREYNSNLEMDYIILTKTGEAPVATKTVTVNSTYGKSTFSSKNALVFNEDAAVKAWIAKSVKDGVVTLERVKGAVAANTGLVVTGSTADVPVAVSGTAYADNQLVAVAANTEVTTGYVLSVQSGSVVFAPVGETAATVEAGHAYLTASAGSKALTLSFAGNEATGINSINAEQKAANEFFNLAGQRVAAPQKGLYILNGKKVIVK